MIARVPPPSRARSAAVLLAVAGAVLLLGGCGSSAKSSSSSSESVGEQRFAGTPPSCAATVMQTLQRIVERVYREGVRGPRIGSAKYVLRSSTALRSAVEAGSAAAARAAAKQLLATGHLTDLRVSVGSRTLVAAGKPGLTPLNGTLEDAEGAPLASYVASVWSDEGFMAEVGGVIEGYVALLELSKGAGEEIHTPRGGAHLLAGSFPLPTAGLTANAGTLTHDGIVYRYASFPGEAYPAGAVRIYLLREASTTARLCARSSEGTVLNTVRHVAHLIYNEEHGPPALKQIARVQHNRALLEAVATRDPAATVTAIKALLNEHIVRLRVFASDGELLGDVGRPYVLAPVRAPLRLHGRTIGRFVLSVQDDEGYEKLAKRLEDLDVLVYMNSKIVKNSLGPVTGEVPANGPYSYAGHSFRVFTVHGEAFPSGPLVIRVFEPLPYLSQPIGN